MRPRVELPCEKIAAPSEGTERKPYLGAAEIKIVWKVVQCSRRRPVPWSCTRRDTGYLASSFGAISLLPMTVAIAANETSKYLILLVGGPGKTRTSDLRFRKPLLYPAELRDQWRDFIAARMPFADCLL
jgi:hypothetical protein